MKHYFVFRGKFEKEFDSHVVVCAMTEGNVIKIEKSYFLFAIHLSEKKEGDDELTERIKKNARILDIYAKLCEGKVVKKAEVARKFRVDERSIQRDIDDIRSFLCDWAMENATEQREIVYDRKSGGYRMTGTDVSKMPNSQILTVSKILLESQAFGKKEIKNILEKLVGAQKQDQLQKEIKEILKEMIAKN